MLEHATIRGRVWHILRDSAAGHNGPDTSQWQGLVVGIQTAFFLFVEPPDHWRGLTYKSSMESHAFPFLHKEQSTNHPLALDSPSNFVENMCRQITTTWTGCGCRTEFLEKCHLAYVPGHTALHVVAEIKPQQWSRDERADRWVARCPEHLNARLHHGCCIVM